MEISGPKNKWIVLILAFCMMAAFALADVAQPQPPNEELTVVTTSHRLESGSVAIPALAGNVSELVINSTFVTNGWQGYYGNISGTIVLDDAFNNTMYSWVLTDPEGEVYASRNPSISWVTGNIGCAIIDNIITEEAALNFNWGYESNDGINETFSFSNSHPEFWVSGNQFTADQCGFTVSTYVDDVVDAARSFNETILYSTSDSSMIYTALIKPGGNNGFKLGGDNYDFQMLVPEDGHQGDLSPTDYYFWVEIQ